MKCSASWVELLPWEGNWERPKSSPQPWRSSCRFVATYVPLVRVCLHVLSIVLLCLVVCHSMHDDDDDDDCLSLQSCEETCSHIEPCCVPAHMLTVRSGQSCKSKTCTWVCSTATPEPSAELSSFANSVVGASGCCRLCCSPKGCQTHQ